MHLFRKYLDNRGSALFMVISTMTAVMVSCMAMYFSVVSSRSAQYATFNQQQARSSAVSVADAVLAGMMDGSNPALKSMLDKMWALEIGQKLTTDGNGFAAFKASATGEDDPNIGSYMVEITRISENTFDIIVTTSVNGISDVYHTVIDLQASESAKAPPAPTQVFAATGYVPNDVFLDGGRFITDVFFDNEQTIVNAYGGKNMELWGDLATGGSLMCHAYLKPKNDRSQTFAIRDTYTANFNGPVTFSATAEKSLVLIGGDAYFNSINAGTGFENANVYILGDLHTKGTLSANANYFVNGNVIIEGGVWPSMDHVFCNGIIDASNNKGCGVNGTLSVPLDANKTNGKTKKSWTDKSAEDGILSVSEMVTTLDEKTQSNQYYKWVINDHSPTKDAYVKELDETRHTAVHKTLKYSQNWENPVPTIVLKYGENGEHGCVIDDVVSDNGNQFNHLALVIDTGEDEDNVYTIRVKPNRDFDGDNKNETFSWYPYDTFSSATYMTILVKGRGSVVIDVPEGVTYQDMSFVKFMHYGWYLLGGANPDNSKYTFGERYNSTGGYYESSTIYNTVGIDNANADVNFEKFIHKKCVSGDGCVYKEVKGTDKCVTHTDKDMLTIECSVHGTLSSFCPECHPEKVDNHAGDCVNHVGRKEIDAYLEGNSTMKSRMTGSDGKIIYPTTNIYLVSCDESANIRLSVMENGSNIIQNSFFGYVYAPYMTFKAYGNNAGGGMVRLMGGMTVSDYIIDDSMSLIACWPEKMPSDLMSDDCLQNKLPGLTNKSWKITLNGH